MHFFYQFCQFSESCDQHTLVILYIIVFVWQESPDIPNRFLPVNQNLPVLPLQDILDNNTALSYFIGTLAYVVIVVLSSLFVQLSFF